MSANRHCSTVWSGNDWRWSMIAPASRVTGAKAKPICSAWNFGSSIRRASKRKRPRRCPAGCARRPRLPRKARMSHCLSSMRGRGSHRLTGRLQIGCAAFQPRSSFLPIRRKVGRANPAFWKPIAWGWAIPFPSAQNMAKAWMTCSKAFCRMLSARLRTNPSSMKRMKRRSVAPR